MELSESPAAPERCRRRRWPPGSSLSSKPESGGGGPRAGRPVGPPSPHPSRTTWVLTRIHRRYDVTAAEWAIGAREGDGAGTISGKWGRCLSSAAAGRTCDRLGTLGRARWRGEDAARDPRGAGWRELAGTFGWPDVGSVAVGSSGWEWNRSQPCQGAAELGFPGPAPWKMQGQSACRAGEPSGQGEEPPPEGLGGHDLLDPGRCGLSSGPGCAPSPVPPARQRWRRSGPRGDG